MGMENPAQRDTHRGAAAASGVRLLRPAEVLVPVVVALACGLLLLLPAEMSPDGWFALLSGHEIVTHGLPSYDTLTVWGQGRRWVDQQWLAQLGYYGLYSFGGLRLALIVNAVIVAGSFAAALALALRRGSTLRNVLIVGLPAGFVVGWSASALRPQTMVLPLFIALVWLLISDARQPSWHIFLVVPLLAMWANLHGTVVLASLLVGIYVASSAWGRRKLERRGVVLLVCAIALPFASPYAPHLLGYYRVLLFNSEFARYVPDWMPTRPSIVTLPFYALALATVFLLGRVRSALTLFERVTLLALLMLSLEANRGMLWFTIFALATAPRMLSSSLQGELRGSRRIGYTLLAASACAAAVAAAVVASKPQSWLTSAYPPAAARATAGAAGNESRVFANGAYADWLLLTQPSLRGRVAYDARFEVLPEGRLADAVAVSIGRSDWRRILPPFDVVVLRPEETEMRTALLRDGAWRELRTDRHVVVVRRTP